jgi:nocardicin N-oxygenase
MVAHMENEQVVTDFPFPPPRDLLEFPHQFTAMQRESPVARVRLPNGAPAWLVTRYADVRKVLVDPRFSRALAVESEAARLAPAAILNKSLIGLDPPDHTRLRTLVNRAFTARRIELLRPRVVGLVDRLLDVLERSERPADLVELFCLPLPVLVISEMMGIPEEDREKFLVWSEESVAGPTEPEMVARGYQSLTGYFDALVEAKRREPGDDMLTALITAREEHDRLSHDELVALSVLLLVAGHETTTTLFGLFVVTLMQDRAQWDALREDSGLIPKAIEELLRTVRRSNIGGGFPRIAKEDVVLGGVRISAGDAVIPAMDAGSRDPAVFDRPDELDLTRSENPHFGFGAGIHFCVGAPLARIEMQEGLRRLLERFPGLRLAVPAGELELKPHAAMRSLRRLPVEW